MLTRLRNIMNVCFNAQIQSFDNSRKNYHALCQIKSKPWFKMCVNDDQLKCVFKKKICKQIQTQKKIIKKS